MNSRAMLFLCMFWAQPAVSDTLHGYVVGITDGDTLTLLVDKQQHKIRIAAIDSPERVQAFGDSAKSHIAMLAFNKDAVAECHKKSYERKVCKVLVEGQDIGLLQIRAGMAWWARKFSNEQTDEDRNTYEQAEMMAKLKRLGLWADTNPVPPWDWRHRLK
jgi:endonuclease YncB( thermonuclease family)